MSVRLAFVGTVLVGIVAVTASAQPISAGRRVRDLRPMPSFVVPYGRIGERYREPPVRALMRTPAAPEEDDGDLSRITLRIPETVKARAEEKAAAAGQSLNTWLVGVVRSATHEHAITVDVDLSRRWRFDFCRGLLFRDRFGERNVCNRAFRRVARNGGIIADGRQPAGIDAFDGLSRG